MTTISVPYDAKCTVKG